MSWSKVRFSKFLYAEEGAARRCLPDGFKPTRKKHTATEWVFMRPSGPGRWTRAERVHNVISAAQACGEAPGYALIERRTGFDGDVVQDCVVALRAAGKIGVRA